VDKTLAAKDRIKQKQKAEEGRKKNEDEYIASASKYVVLAFSISSENESNAADISMPDMMEESPPKRPRARQNIVTPSLVPVLDRTQVSERKAAIVLTKIA